jgi:CheY-like chemotaxis protein
MDEPTVSRIFDPFFTTKQPGEGTGLGLSVVRSIIASYNGLIAVNSRPQKGTTFTLLIPACARPSGNLLAASKGVGVREIANVLYVDDEEALVDLMTRLLTRRGLRVTGFTKPHEALAAFRENSAQFDVVVTDLSMPGMSGIELAQAIRDISPNIPLILISGYLQPLEQQQSEALRFHAILEKSTTAEDLAATLSETLTSARPLAV